jgi:deazaflavin-dependent oxidoreductase (nitroreductase family)
MTSVETQFFKMLNQLVEPHVRAGWGSPRLVPGGLVVLETTGRRTGRRLRVPLAAIEFQKHVVVSTFRGNRSQWVRNVAANPNVRYWLRGRARKATGFVISAREDAPSERELPAGARWLSRFLIPYTFAGWAFAVLMPRSRSFANSAGGRRALPRKRAAKGKGRKTRRSRGKSE